MIKIANVIVLKALLLIVMFLQKDFMYALRTNRRPSLPIRAVGFILRGLRSAITSEELKKDLQFRANGMWTTSKIEHGQKLALFLNSAAPDIFPSSTSCKNAIRKGLVRLNGLKAHNTDIVAEGDVIESFVRSQQSAFCGHFEQKVIDDPSAFKLCVVQVLWEDDHCAVIIKPQGMPVFRTKESSGSDDVTGNLPCLQTALPYSLTPVPTDSGLEPLRRPQAVHRLDKGTGGLLLVAKTRPAMINLTAQFAARTVKKKYRAIVVGKLSNQSGTNNREDDSQILTLAKYSNEAGTHPPLAISGTISTMLSRQTALTEWSVQPGMQTKSSLHGWITTVDLSPHTGRTHQLRRHMDIICHPIIGDPDYWFQDGGRLSPFATANQSTLTSNGIDESPSSLDISTAAYPDGFSSSHPQPPRLQGRGMYLWSVGIAFDHPATGARIDLTTEEPESYQQLRSDFLP